MKFQVLTGSKLLPFLRELLSEKYSVKALKRALDSKRCRVNGRLETFATHSLSRGDLVEIEMECISSSSPYPLYEDSSLLILNKPAGLVCMQGHFPHPLVHRLDKETSGALILAKQPMVKQKMIALFATFQISKGYLALVSGEIRGEQGEITLPLLKHPSHVAVSPHGMRSFTRWKCLGKKGGISLLLCEPVTGRTHQIRVHLTAIGHPLLGDTLYGKGVCRQLPIRRQMLHAYHLSFSHPLTDQKIEIKAPLPEDFRSILEFFQWTF